VIGNAGYDHVLKKVYGMLTGIDAKLLLSISDIVANAVVT
jgi:hypothetical protein